MHFPQYIASIYFTDTQLYHIFPFFVILLNMIRVIRYINTHVKEREQYSIWVEVGLSPSGLTQPQNKVYTSTS